MRAVGRRAASGRGVRRGRGGWRAVAGSRRAAGVMVRVSARVSSGKISLAVSRASLVACLASRDVAWSRPLTVRW